MTGPGHSFNRIYIVNINHGCDTCELLSHDSREACKSTVTVYGKINFTFEW